MNLTVVLVAIAIAIGMLGIVVPIIPGVLLIAAAIGVWAYVVGGAAAWTVFGIVLAILVVGQVVKYVIPGRQLKATVPTSTLLIGGVGALIGFFVIPVVGALAGFPAGVYLAEHQRLGRERAWPSTKQALKAVGVSILIELVSAVLATMVWVVGLFIA